MIQLDSQQCELKRTPLTNITLDLLDLSDEKKKDSEEGDFLLCRACTNIITKSAYRITKNGHHTHVFTNPQGVVFEIGCFSRAQGCRNVSKPTAEYTWFPGFRWSISVCSNCQNHIGWHYQSHEDNFYGLILDNLIESE